MRKTIFSALIVIAPAIAGHALAQQPQPSFDCTKAATAVEKAICDNTDLAMLDRALARLYRAAREKGGKAVVTSQRAWLKARARCKEDESCLFAAYKTRLAALARTAGDTKGISGAYDYAQKGSSGSLWLLAEPDGTLTGMVETVTGPTAHTCAISFARAKPQENGWQWTNPDPYGDQEEKCRLTITMGKMGPMVDGSPGCQDFCGLRGIFTGQYRRGK